jgi:hypothetical protein
MVMTLFRRVVVKTQVKSIIRFRAAVCHLDFRDDFSMPRDWDGNAIPTSDIIAVRRTRIFIIDFNSLAACERRAVVMEKPPIGIRDGVRLRGEPRHGKERY